MIDIVNITSEELAEIGIAFDTEEDTSRFICTVRHDLETRIGEAIALRVPYDVFLAFDDCADSDERIAWLEQNVPDFRDIIVEIAEEIESELQLYRNRIPGNKLVHPDFGVPKAPGYEGIGKIFRDNMNKDPDRLLNILENYFVYAGRAFRDGRISEDAFYICTDAWRIFPDVLGKKGNMSFEPWKLEESDTFEQDYYKWIEEGEIPEKPWMERTLKSGPGEKISVDWLFRVIRTLKISPECFRRIRAEQYPMMGIQLDGTTASCILHENCRNLVTLKSEPEPLGKLFYLYFSKGTELHIRIDNHTGNTYSGKGIIPSYMREEGEIEISAEESGMEWVRFNKQKISKLQAMWGTYQIPNLSKNWLEWDLARLEKAYRTEMQYKKLRAPYLTGLKDF